MGFGGVQGAAYGGGMQGSRDGAMPGIAYGGGPATQCGQQQSLTARELLMGASFAFTSKEDEAGGTLSAWGRMSESNFSGMEDELSMNGQLSTALAGVDYAQPGWLAGVALSRTDAKGGYTDESAGAGDLGSSLTAATAYGMLADFRGLEVWGALGHGRGGLALALPDGPGAEADLDWTMAAAGARGGLLEPGRIGGLSLALVTDALWTRTASGAADAGNLAAARADVTRMRVGFESGLAGDVVGHGD